MTYRQHEEMGEIAGRAKRRREGPCRICGKPLRDCFGHTEQEPPNPHPQETPPIADQLAEFQALSPDGPHALSRLIVKVERLRSDSSSLAAENKQLRSDLRLAHAEGMEQAAKIAETVVNPQNDISKRIAAAIRYKGQGGAR